jgi:tRNA modification GTPase
MIFDAAPLDDTISAISTPFGRSGIGIVRLSGPDALAITEKIFHPKRTGPIAPNIATYGELRHPQSGEVIDEAVVTFFKKPKSYTGDDLIEISCHGSPVILETVLDLTTQIGARIARPGEFTMRAFLSGRIDLAQAEAVRDLIDAQTTYQAKVAARQIQGSFSKRLQPMKQLLTEMIVHLEAAVEFVEEDISPESSEAINHKLVHLITKLEELERSFSLGRVIREGIQLAIIGRSNVGKSSIFNSLLKKERAIVTPIPGTTRDVLSDVVAIDGIPVQLVDTAGIRQTSDIVEKLGIERSRTAMADADLVLVILDGSENLGEDDLTLIKETKNFPRLIIINKFDLPAKLKDGDLCSVIGQEELVRASALTGLGIADLRRKIVRIITSYSAFESEDVILTNSRHHDLIVRSIRCLKEAQSALEQRYSEEVILVGLHDALRTLGEITGETTIEDIFDQIFSTFCIGK